MRFLLHSGCLLIIALVAPIALPAGGGERRKSEVIYLKGKHFTVAGESCCLFSSPLISSPPLCNIKLGTPIRLIRFWEGQDGKRWAQVQISTDGLINNQSLIRKGWVNV